MSTAAAPATCGLKRALRYPSPAIRKNLFDPGGYMQRFHVLVQRLIGAARVIAVGAAVVTALATLSFPAAAANLAVGLGTDVTAIDPHYHNLTPNNNVAAHIFGYLVERNEKSQLQPGLAT